MPLLEDLGLARCRRCGRLFQMASATTLCRACRPDAKSPSAQQGKTLSQRERALIDNIRRLTGLSPEAVGQALGARPPREAAAPGGQTCVRCGERPSLPGAEFCLSCKVDLYSAFGEASDDLFQRLEVVESEPGGPTSVISALEQKRARTAASRMDLLGTRAGKYWSPAFGM